MKTRNKLKKSISEATVQEKQDIEKYILTEKNNSLIEKNNYDHVFHLFSNEFCDLRSKLEDKWRKTIKINEPMERYKPYSIDKYNTIIIIPRIIQTKDQLEIITMVIKQILDISKKECHERIALNSDFKDAISYFHFKQIYAEIFKYTDIQSSVYLNKVLELTNLDDIKKVMDTYHKSILGGHVGIERMKNNIRRFYNWPSLTKDIKEYIKKCPTCEKTKILKHTKAPMQITSVANEPFEKVYIDHVGPINPPSSEGHNYI